MPSTIDCTEAGDLWADFLGQGQQLGEHDRHEGRAQRGLGLISSVCMPCTGMVTAHSSKPRTR